MSLRYQPNSPLPRIVVVGHEVRALAVLHALQPFLHPKVQAVRVAWITGRERLGNVISGSIDGESTEDDIQLFRHLTLELKKALLADTEDAGDNSEVPFRPNLTFDSKRCKLLAPDGLFCDRVDSIVPAQKLVLLRSGTVVNYDSLIVTTTVDDTLPQVADLVEDIPGELFHLLDQHDVAQLNDFIYSLKPVEFVQPKNLAMSLSAPQFERTFAAGSILSTSKSGGTGSPAGSPKQSPKGAKHRHGSDSDDDDDDDDMLATNRRSFGSSIDDSSSDESDDSDEEPPIQRRPTSVLIRVPKGLGNVENPGQPPKAVVKLLEFAVKREVEKEREAFTKRSQDDEQSPASGKLAPTSSLSSFTAAAVSHRVPWDIVHALR